MDAKDIVVGVLDMMYAFEVKENERDDESWRYGVVADENEPMATFAICKEYSGNGLSFAYTDVGDIHGVPVGAVRHPAVVALLQDVHIHFAIQNMLFFDESRVHAFVALLQLLDGSDGVVHIAGGVPVALCELVSLVFMIMWVAPDAHNCLPFSSASNPTTAYYLLFKFCTSSYKRFQMTRATINPTNRSTTSEVYSVRKVYAIDMGEVYLKVPRTNYNEPSDSNPTPAKRRAAFVRLFVNYCAMVKDADIPQFYAWGTPPLLSVVDCNIDPYTYPFKPMYYKRGLCRDQQRVVWASLLVFARTGTLPPEIVLKMLECVPEVCAFDTLGGERRDMYAVISEDNTDWDVDDF